MIVLWNVCNTLNNNFSFCAHHLSTTHWVWDDEFELNLWWGDAFGVWEDATYLSFCLKEMHDVLYTTQKKTLATPTITTIKTVAAELHLSADHTLHFTPYFSSLLMSLTSSAWCWCAVHELLSPDVAACMHAVLSCRLESCSSLNVNNTWRWILIIIAVFFIFYFAPRIELVLMSWCGTLQLWAPLQFATCWVDKCLRLAFT